MRFRKLTAALALLALAACSRDFVSGPDEGLRVSHTASAVTLTNRSGEALYYTSFELETASVALWAPCVNPVRCKHVAPGASVELDRSDFSGYRAGDDAGIVYYWRLRPTRSGGYEVSGGIQSVHVPL